MEEECWRLRLLAKTLLNSELLLVTVGGELNGEPSLTILWIGYGGSGSSFLNAIKVIDWFT